MKNSATNPDLRKEIIKSLATGRRETAVSEQICLTVWALALRLEVTPEEVLLEIKSMVRGRLVCRPFRHNKRFFSLTLRGQEMGPLKFAT